MACRDPRLDLEPDELPLERIRAARLLHLDATDLAASLAAAGAAREAGIPVVLDADVATVRDTVKKASAINERLGTGVVLECRSVAFNLGPFAGDLTGLDRRSVKLDVVMRDGVGPEQFLTFAQ